MHDRASEEYDLSECVRLAWEGCNKPAPPERPTDPSTLLLPPVPEEEIDRTVQPPVEPGDGTGCFVAAGLVALVFAATCVSGLPGDRLEQGALLVLLLASVAAWLGLRGRATHGQWKREVERLVREREDQVRAAESRQQALRAERDRENERRMPEYEARLREYPEAVRQWELALANRDPAWKRTQDQVRTGYRWLKSNLLGILEDGRRELLRILVEEHLPLARSPLAWRGILSASKLHRPDISPGSCTPVQPSRIGVSFVLLYDDRVVVAPAGSARVVAAGHQGRDPEVDAEAPEKPTLLIDVRQSSLARLADPAATPRVEVDPDRVSSREFFLADVVTVEYTGGAFARSSRITATLRDQRIVQFPGDDSFCSAVREALRQARLAAPAPALPKTWPVPPLPAGLPELAPLPPASDDQAPPATKICPDCAEEVKAAARICRFCRYEFSPVPEVGSP